MKLNEVNWLNLLFVVITHLIVIIGLPLYLINNSPSSILWWGLLILFLLTGLGITMGYHRLYAHKAYTPSNKIVEGVIIFMGTLVTQGSIMQWSFDHRRHHAFVDTDRDPYDIKKGFWHAHWFWMFKKKETVKFKEVPDLAENKLVMFQHNHFGLLTLSTNLIVFLIFGYITKDYLGSFLIIWMLRTVLLHEATWCINSLAHYYGSKHYMREVSAVDNWIVSLFTLGEGYHNYHHAFAVDYRNGIEWYNFDPGKWVIWTLSKMGLVKDKIKMSNNTIMRRLIREDIKLMNEEVSQSKRKDAKKIKNKIKSLSTSMYKLISKMEDAEKTHNINTSTRASEEFKILKKEWIKLSKELEH